MPDNFVPIEIVYNLYVHACRNAENLPSFARVWLKVSCAKRYEKEGLGYL